MYVLSKEEGGRHTPFFNGYRPQFYFRTTDVTGDIQLEEGEMVMPGDNSKFTRINHTNSNRRRIKILNCEGGRTVGSGVVTKVLDNNKRLGLDLVLLIRYLYLFYTYNIFIDIKIIL